MADNDTSKIRYDDFISSVQPDPAKPESTIMLSGFIGHGPDGHARVYPDPTLGTWYDIPEGDILHSMPIADSKLGGSHIWVRANAQIKPGSAAPQATEAPQQAAAVGINPMNPTPATHCFICPPPTGAERCWTAVRVCDNNMQMPTPATRCFICPAPHPTPLTIPPWLCGQPGGFTPATVCTHAACPTQPVVCNLQPTQPVVCGLLPPSFGCTQGCQQAGAHPQLEAMAAPAHPNTAATLCTQQPACPPRTVHNSMCICPTPSAVHQCGGQTVFTPTFTPTIPQFTLVGACPTFGACPSIACGFTPVQNGVFTPFGR